MAKRRTICLALIFIFSIGGIVTSIHLAQIHYKKPKYLLNLVNAVPPLGKFYDKKELEKKIEEQKRKDSGEEENPLDDPNYDPYAPVINPYGNIKTEKDLKGGAGPESCDLSKEISCTAVDESDYSEIFGISVSLYGVKGYAILAFLSLISIARLRSRMKRAPGPAAAAPDIFVFILYCGILVGTGFSAWLTYLEAVEIGAYCPYCLVSAALIVLCLISSIAGYGISPLRHPFGPRK